MPKMRLEKVSKLICDIVPTNNVQHNCRSKRVAVPHGEDDHDFLEVPFEIGFLQDQNEQLVMLRPQNQHVFAL